MASDQTPLYVRLSADPNRRLERAVSILGKSKRQLIEDAVREHLGDDGLVVGQATLREDRPEILTLDEAAALLRLEAPALDQAAQNGELPGRKIGGEWRFSKEALLSWLAQSTTDGHG